MNSEIFEELVLVIEEALKEKNLKKANFGLFLASSFWPYLDSSSLADKFKSLWRLYLAQENSFCHLTKGNIQGTATMNIIDRIEKLQAELKAKGLAKMHCRCECSKFRGWRHRGIICDGCQTEVELRDMIARLNETDFRELKNLLKKRGTDFHQPCFLKARHGTVLIVNADSSEKKIIFAKNFFKET